jgi:hypothetical protein
MNLLDKISSRKLEVTLVIGIFLGLGLGFLISPEKSVEKKVIEKEGVVTANEVCSTIYGADYGHGHGLAHMSCAKDGTYYDLGMRDLSKAINNSYNLGG